MTEYSKKGLNNLANPFTSSQYILNSCSLQKLTQEDAVMLGKTLAQIEPWNTLNYSANRLSSYLCQEEPLLYKFRIVISEQLVGVICIRYPWLRGAYLELLAIYPAQQKQGLGKEIMLWFEKEVQQTSCNLWALVSSFNDKAQCFYKRIGFTEIGTIKDFLVSGHDEILLRKIIN
jgi:diamine N-acetyltransferase